MRGQVAALIDTAVSTRRPERLALAFGLLTGLLGVALAAADFATGPELDYHAYYFAGRAVLQGEPFIGWAITEGSFLTEKAYVYPPITAPVFAIYALFPTWQIGYVLNVGALLVVFALLARLIIRFTERHGVDLTRLDRLLILGFCLGSGHTVLGLYRGNIDPAILLLLAVGLVAIEDGDELLGGTLWGLAALFKLFPAFLGIWLLYRRASRAIAAAVVTGGGLLLLGVAIFGIDAHVQFFEFIIHERSREGAFRGGLDPTLLWITLRRPLSYLVALSGNQLMIVSAAIMAPFVYLVYRDADSALDRTVAFFATMVVLLITIVPSTLNYVVYLYFPLVPLLYLAEDRTTKRLFVAGLVLVHFPLYPQHVQLIVDALPLTAGLGEAIVAVARAVLTYTSIPLLGFLVLLGGCLRFVRSDGLESQPERAVARAD